MLFPFALSRTIILSFIVITNVTLFILSVIAFHERTGGTFQSLALFFSALNLLTIFGCLCHQIANRDEETSNTRNVVLFSFCGLLSCALAASLTVHARQDRGVGLCNDFANSASPCTPAGIEVAMAYVSLVLALTGFIISWMDKHPGAVKVMPRYPITKAPSSRYATHTHELEGVYTSPPVKKSSRGRNNSEWSDVPVC